MLLFRFYTFLFVVIHTMLVIRCHFYLFIQTGKKIISIQWPDAFFPAKSCHNFWRTATLCILWSCHTVHLSWDFKHQNLDQLSKKPQIRLLQGPQKKENDSLRSIYLHRDNTTKARLWLERAKQVWWLLPSSKISKNKIFFLGLFLQGSKYSLLNLLNHSCWTYENVAQNQKHVSHFFSDCLAFGFRWLLLWALLCSFLRKFFVVPLDDEG